MSEQNETSRGWYRQVPNILTVLRLVMVPALVVCMIWFPRPTQSGMWISFAIFTAAALTDKIDGDLARRWSIVSNFGKIADPIADKLLVLPALVLLAWQMGYTHPTWVVVITWICCALIIVREVGISVWRLVLVRSGRVVAASRGGKLKTVAQMGFIGLSLIPWNIFAPEVVVISMRAFCFALLLAATGMSLKTGAAYVREQHQAGR